MKKDLFEIIKEIITIETDIILARNNGIMVGLKPAINIDFYCGDVDGKHRLALTIHYGPSEAFDKEYIVIPCSTFKELEDEIINLYTTVRKKYNELKKEKGNFKDQEIA